jgi:hypothetical protein
MKWAKLSNDPDLKAKGLNEKDRKSLFNVYGSITPNVPKRKGGKPTIQQGILLPEKSKKSGRLVRKSITHDFRKWKTYRNISNHFREKSVRKDYELFCAGWLKFYDKIVNKEHNHVMFFDWVTQNQLTIWLWPNAQQRPKGFSYQVYLPAVDPPTPPPPPPPPPRSS